MKKTLYRLLLDFYQPGQLATSVSAREYKVQKGDTLSGIGHVYDAFADHLRVWNDLDSDLIVVNQLLYIQNEDTSDNVENNDDRTDLHMGDDGEATDWGRQDVEVTVK